jgi:hypothetical protein
MRWLFFMFQISAMKVSVPVIDPDDGLDITSDAAVKVWKESTAVPTPNGGFVVEIGGARIEVDDGGNVVFSRSYLGSVSV